MSLSNAINIIQNDLKRKSAVDNPESLMREISLFNSYIPYVSEELAKAEAVYRRIKQEVGLDEEVTVLSGKKFEIAVDSGSSSAREDRDILERLFKILIIRIDSLRTILSMRKTELDKFSN